MGVAPSNVEPTLHVRHFIPKDKKLNGTSSLLLDMLSSPDHDDLCYVITDPELADNPIIFASSGFCRFTGYMKDEIEGRNCRFLQGKETDPVDVEKIRKSIEREAEANVCLLNYRKDGSTFYNQFFICPLKTTSGSTGYFIGVQVAVADAGKGQQIENPGWVYTMGLRA